MKDISKIIDLDKFGVTKTKEEPKKTVSEIAENIFLENKNKEKKEPLFGTPENDGGVSPAIKEYLKLKFNK